MSKAFLAICSRRLYEIRVALPASTYVYVQICTDMAAQAGVMCVCIYIYIYEYVYIHIYVYSKVFGGG